MIRWMMLVLLGLALIMPAQAQSDTVQTIDLIELAPQAVWTSTRGNVTFGDDQYGVTIVDYRYNVRFNDGSTASRTLYTPIFEFDVKTNVTGLFNLKLPQAGKITLNCQVNGPQNWMHGVGAECRVPAEGISLKPSGRPIDWFDPGDFRDGKPFDFSIDLASVAGKDVEIVLKAQANRGGSPGLFHWTKAEIVYESDAALGTVLLSARKTPDHALRIKRIEGLPRPWKADELHVVFNNTGVDADNYRLSYSLKDFWGKSLVANESVALPSTPGFTVVGIDLKPKLGNLLGWYEAEVKLKYKGRVIDNRSINISRVAPRPTPLSPLMGIQTFFWLYSDDEVSADLELIRDLGARYVRCNGVDRTEELLAQGNGEYVMTYIPNSNQDAINAQGYTAEIEQKIYKDTFALVTQFKGRVKHYELGNEYNPYISAENCAKMYKTIYAAAKAADPNCIVNTVGFGDKAGEEPAYSTAWFKKLYELAGESIDNLSLHSYTLWAVPDRDELLMKHCQQPVQTYIDILKGFGAYPAKNIWISEYGWFASDRNGWDRQAQNTVRQYLLGAKYNIPMIQFLLMDSGYDNSRDGVQTEGLCYFNREPKPAFAAYAVLARQLSGASFAEEKPLGPNSFAYVFEKQGKRFTYLWKSVAPREMITLPALGKSVTVMDMMGNSKSVAASSSGTVSLALSFYPIRVDGLDIDGFKVIGRKTMADTGLAHTEAGSALLKNVKKLNDPSAWVRWAIAEKEWRASGSMLVVSEYITQAYDHMDAAGGRKTEPMSSERLVRCKKLKDIKLDGNLEEWSLLPSYQGRNHTMTACDSKDLSFSFKVGWNDACLYIAVDVTDDVVINESPAQTAYNGDAIELWFSALNNKTPRLGPGDYQYVFGVAGQQTDTAFKSGGKTQAKCAVHKTNTGYTMEIAVPLSELLLSKIKSGYAIGFDIAVDDADGSSGKEHQMLYNARSAEVFMNSSLWGDMIFE